MTNPMITHYEKVKPNYMAAVHQMVQQAKNRNHSKADLFVKVEAYLEAQTDPEYWWGQWTAQELMNKAAKEVLGKKGQPHRRGEREAFHMSKRFLKAADIDSKFAAAKVFDLPEPVGLPEVYGCQCDNGHKWRATDAEDRAADHKCPVCGKYWQ